MLSILHDIAWLDYDIVFSKYMIRHCILMLEMGMTTKVDTGQNIYKINNKTTMDMDYIVSFCNLTYWPLAHLNVILKKVNFNPVLLIRFFRSSHDNALWWMPQDLTDDQSTLVQVMAWCRHQAITWANVDPDLCRQMASLGLNELTHSHCGPETPYGDMDLGQHWLK